MLPRIPSDIKKVILHCSASPNDMDIGVKEIRAWHIAQKWSDCGYHYVIRRSGSVEAGRDVLAIGAHCLGHNYDSIGVCLVGTNEFTDQQLESLRQIYESFYATYAIDSEQWYTHNFFDRKKLCPHIHQDKLRLFLSGKGGIS